MRADVSGFRAERTSALVVAALATTAVSALVDLLAPNVFVFPILYVVPLVLFARLRNERALWLLAAVLVGLIFCSYLFAPSASYADTRFATFVNRVLMASAIVGVSALLHFQIRASHFIDGQREELERRNDELEMANHELGQREEEIARQNEELQSQTEELERQSEELRVTNEDLAAREKSLEQLLELSRSLTSDLSRSDVLQKVCDSLGALIVGNAAAVLERRGEAYSVTCYHGFGAAPESELLGDDAFSALVFSVGQTAYIEDLSQRPDLHIPQPSSGERFQSALATPVRVRGRVVATLEMYAQGPQTWNEAHVASIESVAAQLSISLQNAQLLGEIEEERRRFEAAFRSVPVGMILIADPEAKELRVNPAGAALLGVPVNANLAANTAAGTRIRRGVYRDGKPLAPDELPAARVLRGEDVQVEELEIALADGRRLSLAVSAAPFLDGEGNVTGGVSVFVDVTAQKAALRELELRRREAEEASVRKTRFLAAISHDIRTPANAINLMTELIRRASADATLAGQIPDVAERLQRNVAALLDLVGDLLDLARFDSGKVEIVESEFSLNDLLEEEGQQLRPLALAGGLELVVAPPVRPLWLHTDRVKLARIIGNLVENAIKFTPAGSVTISAEMMSEPERRLRIEVTDTGIGIPPENVARIFDEFLQLRNPERDQSKGSGLGLAICKRLIDVLGGSIQVRSTIDAGTTFTVELPSTAIALRLDTVDPAPRRDEAAPMARRLVGLRVLLVEDHAATRDGTREILTQEGAHVVAAPNGATALRLLRDEPVDVMLLDLMLPDMDGSEVLKAISATRPSHLKGVIVLTGDFHQRRLDDLPGVELDAIIQKPVDVNVLVKTLESFRRYSR